MRTMVKGMISLSSGFTASVPVYPSPYSILPELTGPPPPQLWVPHAPPALSLTPWLGLKHCETGLSSPTLHR